MENLYRKNKNLFERVLDKLKEFVKNLREYFAHVNPNTKVEAAALKENTENGMRYLEKIVEAFDKTAEAAVENYQQGTTESTAESKTQYKTRGKYWRPDLKDSEWKLLERRMAEEIGSSENYLDDATKWVYAEEKGIQVFALFGIGDGTDATPLYASAGRTARADAKMLMDYTVEENQYDGNRKDLNTLLEGYGRSNGNGSRNFSDGKRGSAKNRVAGLSGGSQRSDTGGTAERSSEDQRGVKEKFSLRDSAGHELTEAQQEYFKDSKVRDADGKSYLYDLLDIKKEKVISSTSFSAQGRSEVFEPKPSREQYMQNPRESQPEKTGNNQRALRDVALSDRDVLRGVKKAGRHLAMLADFGAEGGSRTLARVFKPPTPLAGEPLRPLGYFCRNIWRSLAERVGFEPTDAFTSPVFKTGAFDHSAISPCVKVRSTQTQELFYHRGIYLSTKNNGRKGVFFKKMC